jgi:hypothetical protein
MVTGSSQVEEEVKDEGGRREEGEDGEFEDLLLHGQVELLQVVECGGNESAVLGGEEGVLDLLLFVLLRYFFKNLSADRVIP